MARAHGWLEEPYVTEAAIVDLVGELAEPTRRIIAAGREVAEPEEQRR